VVGWILVKKYQDRYILENLFALGATRLSVELGKVKKQITGILR
jgi:hypothetical protein